MNPDQTTTYTVYNAYLNLGGNRYRPIEVQPFTRDYDFDSEQAAIDAARANYGDETGFVIREQEITERTVHRVQGAGQ